MDDGLRAPDLPDLGVPPQNFGHLRAAQRQVDQRTREQVVRDWQAAQSRADWWGATHAESWQAPQRGGEWRQHGGRLDRPEPRYGGDWLASEQGFEPGFEPGGLPDAERWGTDEWQGEPWHGEWSGARQSGGWRDAEDGEQWQANDWYQDNRGASFARNAPRRGVSGDWYGKTDWHAAMAREYLPPLRPPAVENPDEPTEWGWAHPANPASPEWAARGGFRRVQGRKHGRRTPRRFKLPPIWVLVSALILIIAGAVVAPRVFASAPYSCQWYMVKSGDSLPALAAEYGTDMNTLITVNQISDPKQLYAGQRLCIPSAAKVDTVVTQAPKTATPGPTTPAAPTPSSGKAKPKGANPQPAGKSSPTPKAPAGAITGSTAFIQLALPYARKAHTATGWPVSMILAQWGVEHGWKLPGFTGYNWGNVRPVPGQPTTGASRFAYAATPEIGLSDYLEVAGLSYYRKIAPAAHTGADAAAVELGRSPWDAGHYGGAANPGSSLLRVMKSLNLYQYDK
jgi:LysM repeat protein